MNKGGIYLQHTTLFGDILNDMCNFREYGYLRRLGTCTGSSALHRYPFTLPIMRFNLSRDARLMYMVTRLTWVVVLGRV